MRSTYSSFYAAADAEFVRGYLLPVLDLSSSRVLLVDELTPRAPVTTEIARGYRVAASRSLCCLLRAQSDSGRAGSQWSTASRVGAGVEVVGDIDEHGRCDQDPRDLHVRDLPRSVRAQELPFDVTSRMTLPSGAGGVDEAIARPDRACRMR